MPQPPQAELEEIEQARADIQQKMEETEDATLKASLADDLKRLGRREEKVRQRLEKTGGDFRLTDAETAEAAQPPGGFWREAATPEWAKLLVVHRRKPTTLKGKDLPLDDIFELVLPADRKMLKDMLQERFGGGTYQVVLYDADGDLLTGRFGYETITVEGDPIIKSATSGQLDLSEKSRELQDLTYEKQIQKVKREMREENLEASGGKRPVAEIIALKESIEKRDMLDVVTKMIETGDRRHEEEMRAMRELIQAMGQGGGKSEVVEFLKTSMEQQRLADDRARGERREQLDREKEERKAEREREKDERATAEKRAEKMEDRFHTLLSKMTESKAPDATEILLKGINIGKDVVAAGAAEGEGSGLGGDYIKLALGLVPFLMQKPSAPPAQGEQLALPAPSQTVEQPVAQAPAERKQPMTRVQAAVTIMLEEAKRTKRGVGKLIVPAGWARYLWEHAQADLLTSLANADNDELRTIVQREAPQEFGSVVVMLVVQPETRQWLKDNQAQIREWLAAEAAEAQATEHPAQSQPQEPPKPQVAESQGEAPNG